MHNGGRESSIDGYDLDVRAIAQQAAGPSHFSVQRTLTMRLLLKMPRHDIVVYLECMSNCSATSSPSIKGYSQEEELGRGKDYRFQTVLFTDERRATLDEPDGWRRG